MNDLQRGLLWGVLFSLPFWAAFAIALVIILH